jgi:hypothetical protein
VNSQRETFHEKRISRLSELASLGATDSTIEFRRVVLESCLDLPLQSEKRESEFSGEGFKLFAVLLSEYQAARQIPNAVFDAARWWHGDENLSCNTPRVEYHDRGLNQPKKASAIRLNSEVLEPRRSSSKSFHETPRMARLLVWG